MDIVLKVLYDPDRFTIAGYSSVIEKLKRRSNILAAYASLVYFFEIMYIMIALLFLYGKPLALITGLTLTALLSVQIIGIYQKKEINRKIQLFLMDVHCAYALPFLLNIAFFGFSGTAFDAFFVVIRALLAAFEVPAIYLLTDESVSAEYARS